MDFLAFLDKCRKLGGWVVRASEWNETIEPAIVPTNQAGDIVACKDCLPDMSCEQCFADDFPEEQQEQRTGDEPA